MASRLPRPHQAEWPEEGKFDEPTQTYLFEDTDFVKKKFCLLFRSAWGKNLGQIKVGISDVMIYIHQNTCPVKPWCITTWLLGQAFRWNDYSPPAQCIFIREISAVVRRGCYGVPDASVLLHPIVRVHSSQLAKLSWVLNKLRVATSGSGGQLVSIALGFGHAISHLGLLTIMAVLMAVPFAVATTIHFEKRTEMQYTRAVLFCSLCAMILHLLGGLLVLGKAPRCLAWMHEWCGGQPLREDDLTHEEWKQCCLMRKLSKRRTIAALLLFAFILIFLTFIFAIFYQAETTQHMRRRLTVTESPEVIPPWNSTPSGSSLEATDRCDTKCRESTPSECQCSFLDKVMCRAASSRDSATLDQDLNTTEDLPGREPRLRPKPNLDMCDDKILINTSCMFLMSGFAVLFILLADLLVLVNSRMQEAHPTNELMDYSVVELYGCTWTNPKNAPCSLIASFTLWSGDAEEFVNEVSRLIHPMFEQTSSQDGLPMAPLAEQGEQLVEQGAGDPLVERPHVRVQAQL